VAVTVSLGVLKQTAIGVQERAAWSALFLFINESFSLLLSINQLDPFSPFRIFALNS